MKQLGSSHLRMRLRRSPQNIHKTFAFSKKHCETIGGLHIYECGFAAPPKIFTKHSLSAKNIVKQLGVFTFTNAASPLPPKYSQKHSLSAKNIVKQLGVFTFTNAASPLPPKYSQNIRFQQKTL